MKKLILTILLCAIVAFSAKVSLAYTRVRSYFRSNGAFVQSHFRTNTDSYKYNNWSYRGNTNPMTGRRGYKW